MRKRVARRLRRAAERLDPPPTPLVKIMMSPAQALAAARRIEQSLAAYQRPEDHR